MDCVRATNLIVRLSGLRTGFDIALKNTEENRSAQIKDLVKAKVEISGLIGEFYKEYADLFLPGLYSEKHWQGIVDKIHSGGRTLTYYSSHPGELLDCISFPEGRIGLTDRSFELFLKSLIAFKDSQLYVKIETDLEFQEENNNVLLALLSAIFLRQNLKDLTLNIRNLPSPFDEGFEVCTKSGTLNIDRCDLFGLEMEGGIISAKEGSDVGQFMNGGIINVERADEVGGWMNGGKIVVGECNEMAGQGANGGAITIEKSTFPAVGKNSENAIFIREGGDYLGYNKRAGVIIVESAGSFLGQINDGEYIGNPDESTATILVGYCEPTVDESPLEIYTYLHTTKKYVDIRNGMQPGLVSTDAELNSFLERKQGLEIIESLSGITVNPTDGMEGGILVLRDLPEGHLGKNMKNCAVIVDVWTDIDPKDVKKLIDKDRKPGDGLILMRVPDPENPDRRKLIDLEAYE